MLPGGIKRKIILRQAQILYAGRSFRLLADPGWAEFFATPLRIKTAASVYNIRPLKIPPV